MKKIIAFIKKYFADIIIQIGIFILTKESLGLEECTLRLQILRMEIEDYPCGHITQVHSAQLKIFAIMLISIGINIAVRRYFRDKRIKLKE